MKKNKILITAYACSPYDGSEPGVGWNYISRLYEDFEIHVIVEKKKWELPISRKILENPKFKKINFYFIEKKRFKLLRKIWPPSYYWFYRDWQKKVFKLAIKLHKENNFDLFHHLTMVGYREPGYLWKLNKPFIWGPVGGFDNSPFVLISKLDFHGVIFFSFRNVINFFQRNFNLRLNKILRKKDAYIISATKTNHDFLLNRYKVKTPIIPEVGKVSGLKTTLTERKPNHPLKIVWCGKLITGKNLTFLLKVLSEIEHPFELNIIGKGVQEQKMKLLCKKLNIEDKCKWHDWLEPPEVLNILKKSHLMCITSISELTSTVLIEGLSAGLPIIAFNLFGFKNIVTEKCGILIPVESFKKMKKEYQKAIEFYFLNENIRIMHCIAAKERSEFVSWEKNINSMKEVYEKAIQEN